MNTAPPVDVVAITSGILTSTRRTEPKGRRETNPLLLRQLDPISELLMTIDTLTMPGQREAMRKIVSFIEVQLESRLGLGARNRRTLADLVTLLRDETERAWSDVGTFTLHAENVLMLLRAPP